MQCLPRRNIGMAHSSHMNWESATSRNQKEWRGWKSILPFWFEPTAVTFSPWTPLLADVEIPKSSFHGKRVRNQLFSQTMKNEGGWKVCDLFAFHSSFFTLHSSLQPHRPILDVQPLRGAGREAATREVVYVWMNQEGIRRVDFKGSLNVVLVQPVLIDV